MKQKSCLIIFLTVFVVFSCSDSYIAQELLAEESFSFEGIQALDVRTGFCNIELYDTSGETLHMDGEIKGNSNPDKWDIEYSKDGDKVSVWIENPKSVWGNIQGLLKFKVPAGTLVTINNSSGNVLADGLQAEDLYVKCSSGNIKTIKTKANFEIIASSGNITVEGHRGDMKASASSGNLKVSDVNGNLIVKASSGNITLREIIGHLKAKCLSGNISMSQVMGVLSAECSSGNIKGKSVTLKGDSDFRTTSGNIDIELENGQSELSFDLDAGSGNLYAGGNRGEDRLYMKEGEVWIKGISSSGNQKYLTHSN
ncbi:DUF4097 domain-containing protein [Bacteroidota bacterium]